MPNRIIEMVIAKAGGMRALGRALGINYQPIQRWKKIPAERVVAIEETIGIPREELRPDLYLTSKGRSVVFEAKTPRSSKKKKVKA